MIPLPIRGTIEESPPSGQALDGPGSGSNGNSESAGVVVVLVLGRGLNGLAWPEEYCWPELISRPIDRMTRATPQLA